MIRCEVQIRRRGKWVTAKRLGEFKRVADARKAMFAVKHHYHVEARLLSQFGTVVDATYLKDAEDVA
jgi:hypothetical protein